MNRGAFHHRVLASGIGISLALFMVKGELFAETVESALVKFPCREDEECVAVQCGCGWRAAHRDDTEEQDECRSLSAVVECEARGDIRAAAKLVRARCSEGSCTLRWTGDPPEGLRTPGP